MARRAELSDAPGSLDSADHIFVEIALEVFVFQRKFINGGDDFFCDERIRQGEGGVLHIAGIGALAAVFFPRIWFSFQGFNEGKHLRPQYFVYLLGLFVSEDMPPHGLSFVVLGEYSSAVRNAQESVILFIICFNII